MQTAAAGRWTIEKMEEKEETETKTMVITSATETSHIAQKSGKHGDVHLRRGISSFGEAQDVFPEGTGNARGQVIDIRRARD